MTDECLWPSVIRHPSHRPSWTQYRRADPGLARRPSASRSRPIYAVRRRPTRRRMTVTLADLILSELAACSLILLVGWLLGVSRKRTYGGGWGARPRADDTASESGLPGASVGRPGDA